MPNPEKPVIAYSYTGFQASLGDGSFPGTQIDADFAELVTSVDQTIDALGDVRRSDGALRNGIVTPESLSAGLLIGVPAVTIWVTAHAYTAGDVVVQSNKFYVCAVAHTSGVFATDLAAVKWVEVTLSITGYSADLVTYDHTISGLVAVNVKTALDEIDGRVDTLETKGIPLVSKSAGYTAVAGDAGSAIRFSASATLALTAAATLGAKWSCWVLADGGNVTIDPNGVETVNGLTTIMIPNGCGGLLVCTGSAFHLVGGSRGIMIIEDQKASGTAGGTFTLGADRTRDLNTVVANTIAGASLATNQFTLPAGVYNIKWSCPVYKVNLHQAFLYNVTDAVVVARGQSAWCGAADSIQTQADGETIVTITATKIFEIRHRSSATEATDGFGNATSFGTEVYSRVRVEKIG